MLRVRLLGEFRVERDGDELDSTDLGSRKARTVIKLLAAHRGLRVTLTKVHPDRLWEAAGEWAGTLGAMVPELHRLLQPLDYQPAPPELERRRAFQAIAGLFAALARQRPLLIGLDDLHLAGASTVELLHLLLRWERAAPLLMLATLRSEEAEETVVQLGPLAAVVEVGPLPDAAVAELAARMGSAERAADVAALTRGHTLSTA